MFYELERLLKINMSLWQAVSGVPFPTTVPPPPPLLRAPGVVRSASPAVLQTILESTFRILHLINGEREAENI